MGTTGEGVIKKERRKKREKYPCSSVGRASDS
jgi:hypothetical protein